MARVSREAMTPKAESVTKDGTPDGWVPPRSFRAQVAPDGATRLVASLPPAELPEVHLKLLAALSAPVSVRYLQLTDRRGAGQLPKPRNFVAMDVSPDRVAEAFRAHPELVWADARHQMWLRGRFGEQVVLDELGVLYCYPDDPAFRDALAGLPESTEVGVDGRDYVKVHFHGEADAQEVSLLEALGLREWAG
jgi:hypothetical protein